MEVKETKKTLWDRIRRKNQKKPLAETFSEEDFFSRTADSFGTLVRKRFFRNKMAVTGVVVLSFLILVSICAPLICPYPAEQSHLEALTDGKPLSPNKDFIWGTDALGRDYFTRCIYGGRVSLFVGFAAVIIQAAIGIPLGCLAGYCGGKVDMVIMRFLEVFNSIPTFIVIIIIAASLERSIWNVIWVMGVFYWPSFVRMIRGYFMALKQQDFVQAAHALGLHPLTIIVRHMLPSAMMPILITVSTSIIGAVMTETSLSYLGFGVIEPTPTWGALLNASQRWLRWVPTMSIFPGVLITLVTLSLNFIADGLRDAFDPRTQV
jgi:peptide/nickel transport system permease protein